MEMLKLRNGSEEAKVLVVTVMISLESLWSQGLNGILAVYDLREICNGKSASVQSETVKKLQDLALVQPDGKVHESIKNVVLSALEGESLETTLVSPLARPASASPTASGPRKTNG